MTLPAILIVPGYSNSGPQHWQTLWQAAHSDYRRVEQQDWDNPHVTEWVETLDQSVRTVTANGVPVVFVAHSLGCLTIVHWARRLATPNSTVAGALLVAPPDVEQTGTEDIFHSFVPIPLMSLPFPSIVVSSTTDPYTSSERARVFATAWGARFVDIGAAGHINTAAGFGLWPEGEQLLTDVLGMTSAKHR